MSRLLHYSSKPIKRLRTVKQSAHPDGRHDKPVGLWVSVEGEMDWREWCEAEDYGSPARQICYEVSLSSDARILRITNGADMLAFNDQYVCRPYGDNEALSYWTGIDWPKVAKEYRGIIIAPYQWHFRHHERVRWYYSWDCASGCIWDRKAIAAIREIRSEVAA